MDLLKFFRRKQVETTSELRHIYELDEVFTPGQPADKGFVNRPSQESDLRNVLDERGSQILVWGESGAGKSSLVVNVLRQAKQPSVTTRCEATTTYDQLLASAFDQLRAVRKVSSSNQDTRTLSAGSEIGGGTIPASIHADASWELGTTTEWEPIVPAQLTSHALALYLGSRGFAWVIEDFHKVAPAVRTAMSDTMKVFSDESPSHPRLRIVVTGVADNASEILRAPSNMGGRLADIPVPPLDDDQLGALLEKSKELLNVDFDQVRDSIIRHSVGVASITHSLARECCLAMGVRRTAESRVVITPVALETAKSAYVRTRGGNMKEDFDVALEVAQTRRYNNYAIILQALAALPEKGATHAQLIAEIRKTHDQYPAGNLTTYLKKLQTEERRSLVRKTSEGLFRYNRPLQQAYAILRFGLVASYDGFWAQDLTVAPADQERAIQAASEENQDAPNDLPDDA
ncbi:ATP-binding protein [Herbiconiux sp. YIM B11900]|uniref:ATP-binding protein n=1 Tax=Herbiconiux sp. YIM B11900 TaxID=3404131 RepID=UPI003F878C32